MREGIGDSEGGVEFGGEKDAGEMDRGEESFLVLISPGL